MADRIKPNKPLTEGRVKSQLKDIDPPAKPVAPPPKAKRAEVPERKPDGNGVWMTPIKVGSAIPMNIYYVSRQRQDGRIKEARRYYVGKVQVAYAELSAKEGQDHYLYIVDNPYTESSFDLPTEASILDVLTERLLATP